MLQLGVRFYDPQIGRFTQVDPLWERWNSYVYARNRPLAAVDPTGESSAAAALSCCWPLAAADGPFPIGDAIYGTIVVGAACYDLYRGVCWLASQHGRGNIGDTGIADEVEKETRRTGRPVGEILDEWYKDAFKKDKCRAERIKKEQKKRGLRRHR